MTEAKTILEMIKCVDHTDANAKALINAKVWCYYNDLYFIDIFEVDDKKQVWVKSGKGRPCMNTNFDYCDSRDAIESIQRAGYFAMINKHPAASLEDISFPLRYTGNIEGENGKTFYINSDRELPTAKLVELHLTIQSEEWERNNEIRENTNEA